jgi:hypothetical protein
MDDLHPVVKIFAITSAVASSLFGLWCVGIAFVGGTIPIVGWELEGDLFTGLLFLFFVEPIIVTIGYWLAMMIALPLQFLLGRR